MVSGRTTSALLLILLLIIVIIYCIVLFEWYRRQQVIFRPYQAPLPSDPHFFPLGKITPLSAEEQAQRKEFIEANLREAN